MYREALHSGLQTHLERFLIVSSLDLSSVQKSAFGETLSHPLLNPHKPLQKVCTMRNPKPVYFDLSLYRPDQIPIQVKPDALMRHGELK
jgi:hypothetical protein